MNKLNLLTLLWEVSKFSLFNYFLLSRWHYFFISKKEKTIKEQGEKQIKAIQDKGPIKSFEKFTYDINDSRIVLKEKGIYNKLTKESFEKINNLDKSVDTNKLVFKYKGNTADEDFS